jgi:hypothetical protein
VQQSVHSPQTRDSARLRLAARSVGASVTTQLLTTTPSR